METKLLAIDQLLPASYNPRKALKPGDKEFEKLRRSIEEFGYVEPIVWNKASGHVVGGHQRLSVLKSLGYKDVECVVVDLDDTREKALNIALNKISGEWDEDKLSSLILDLEATDLGTEITGFDPDEIADLTKLMDDEKEERFDLSKALEEASFVEPGDIWTVGRHRLICGDATKAETLDLLMDGKKANLCVTDPPYNASYESSLGLSIKNDAMSSEAFYAFLLDSFRQINAHLTDDASIYVFHSDTEGANFRKSFKDAGFVLDATCIWVKNTLVLGRAPYQWRHEAVLYGHKQGHTAKWFGSKNASTLWFYDKPQKNTEHPTAKPIDLICHPISQATQIGGLVLDSFGGLVLDSFGGSGSTLIACEKTGRTAYLSELDPKYASVILRRYVDYVGSSQNVRCQRGTFDDLKKGASVDDPDYE